MGDSFPAYGPSEKEPPLAELWRLWHVCVTFLNTPLAAIMSHLFLITFQVQFIPSFFQKIVLRLLFVSGAMLGLMEDKRGRQIWVYGLVLSLDM